MAWEIHEQPDGCATIVHDGKVIGRIRHSETREQSVVADLGRSNIEERTFTEFERREYLVSGVRTETPYLDTDPDDDLTFTVFSTSIMASGVGAKEVIANEDLEFYDHAEALRRSDERKSIDAADERG